jgi:type VI secretion system VasD/TssJ family lipoprotein
MKNYLTIGGFLFFLFFVFSCASSPPLPPEYVYSKEAIQIHLKSDYQLNFYQSSPHTLLLCVYQLTDPNAFNQLKMDSQGLSKLLECERIEGTTNANRLIVRPGQDITYKLDRAEGTKYVGIVAGYYFMHTENMVRLYKIPVFIETKGFFSPKKTSKVTDLLIELYLAPQQIKDSTATP